MTGCASGRHPVDINLDFDRLCDHEWLSAFHAVGNCDGAGLSVIFSLIPEKVRKNKREKRKQWRKTQGTLELGKL